MYFRTRIFAISILTVSVVLVIVITLSWSRIMTLELDHLDSRLCLEANRMIRRGDENHPSPHLSILNGSEFSDSKMIYDVLSKLRISLPRQLMLLVESTENGTLMKSEGADIAHLINTLEWSTTGSLASKDKSRNGPRCQLSFFEHQDSQWRAGYSHDQQTQSFIAVDLSATTSQLKSSVRTAFIVVIPFSLLLSILGAWFIATNTMRPINRLHKSMNRVTQKDLCHRLPEHKEDKEFKMLIDAYNTMLDRLEDSFQQTSRFTADVAHELKTPLTVLRGKLEQAVICDNSSPLDLNAILDEVGHLSAITRKLLLLSQADSCSMALHLEPINMTELLDELTADFELLAEQQVLHCSIATDLRFKGDIILLRQLLNNLLVNVMRYSVHEKGVTIQGKQHETSIEVLISNFCIPLSNDVRCQLFDRFYRGEEEQTQGISGSGLGLSLAREIARAHGGELVLEASNNNVFTIRLLLPIVK